MKHNQIISILGILSAVLLCSCDDWFAITPQSEMVAEDFWKDKTDVESAVGSCYKAISSDAFVRRLIVWGEVRSDNVIYGQTDETDLTHVLNANITPSNSYANWGDVYAAINYCNIVIEKAPAVRDSDPNFSQTELNQFLAEAKAIRAFCYFTLVRTFRDVPYITQPYTDDTRAFAVAQSSAADILAALIADLKTVEDNVVTEYSQNVPYTRGRITQKAVWALMADICLWQQDYDGCITYCDKVLAATSNPLHLLPSSHYFQQLFFTGNSEESIFELQYDTHTGNSAVTALYGGSSTTPLLCCSSLSDLRGTGFMREKDIRTTDAYVLSSGAYLIKKYVAQRNAATTTTPIKATDFSWGDGTCNWILYRLPDIYLMKAEALVERGGSDDIAEAVSLVSLTYDRANPDLDPNTLQGTYNQHTARELVMDERQREFLFEGKRYFDLVRLMRRQGGTQEVVTTYLITKYVTMSLDQSTVMSKINDPDAIYMPISEHELRLNPLLVQNRFYQTSTDIVRN